MKKLWITMILPVLLAVSFTNDKHRSVKKTDANGFTYEEVTGDPYKARIYTLANGLKVYLAKNTDEPRIQTMIAVRAGSKDDPRDNTGLAHYLEHMMFKGTNHFGTADWKHEKPLLDSIAALFEAHKAAQTVEEKRELYKQIDAVSQAASKFAISNEYDKIIGALGASGTNAFTSYDMTAYINDIPANEIEKFMKLEYDRFTNIQLRLFHTELETVYEEFNMYQDQGWSVMSNKMFEGLFAEHPYKVDVIGLPEHLKSPSMNSVMAYQKYYYVPNNMAVILSGDLDFEKTIVIVNRYFGQMAPNKALKHAEPVVEAPLTACKTFEVATPDQERIAVAYRFGAAKSRDALMLELIQKILSNGKAGLFDLDMVQKQKVLSLSAGADAMKDYGVFMIVGTPREGQSLEELGTLVQNELAKLKAGDFSDDLLEAVINNEKLSIIRKTDNRYSAVNDFLTAFINEEDWKDAVSRIDEMAKVTKAEIVAFANNFFKNNYVTVYKRTGTNKNKVEVEKPHITPIAINRDVESTFSKELMAMKSDPIEPVFLDYKKIIEQKSVKDGIDFYYTHNPNNKIYQLDKFVNISRSTDKKLALAFQYLPYLGTSKYSPEQLKMEMYKLAMSFGASSGSTRSFVSVYGLNETFDRSLKLMDEMMNDAMVNKEAYNNMVNDILKRRTNNKLNKSAILRGGLVNYLKYGAKSPQTDILSEAELKAIDPQELVDAIKNFANYKHSYVYYGPDPDTKVLNMLKKIPTPKKLVDTPNPVVYPELPMDKPVVYFADYDMVQAEVMLLAKDVAYNPEIVALQDMFGSYYGENMSSVVFQEIREARGLAYSAYAYVATPALAGRSNYIQAYVGTQSDKMKTAIDAFKDMLSNMITSEKSFALSKEYALNNMRSQRITKSSIFWNYMYLKDLGVDYDIRKPVYEAIQKMTLNDLAKYFNEHIKSAKYSIVLVGKRDKIDFEYLKSIATVKELTLEELFGY